MEKRPLLSLGISFKFKGIAQKSYLEYLSSSELFVFVLYLTESCASALVVQVLCKLVLEASSPASLLD